MKAKSTSSAYFCCVSLQPKSFLFIHFMMLACLLDVRVCVCDEKCLKKSLLLLLLLLRLLFLRFHLPPPAIAPRGNNEL